ncbi:MAG: right-handed parallel beta-helix repeat-containing protein, partial [Cytophaga sp.]|uniref:right-handed parallel beta-helix repeat-containing protein n=1 Tax=Cytophaga sp. TaxID=29535 RepID=UPI003F7FFF8A
MRHFISTVILFLALIFSNTLLAKVYYVNANYTGSTQNGNSWTTPFKTIEKALTVTVDGDQIWVAKGTYTTPNYKSASGYFINNGITIYGGFAGTETSVFARDLALNKSIIQTSNTSNIFNIKQNKDFIIDGVDLTSFGTALFIQYDTIATAYNIQSGDRFKVTLNNCNIYNGQAPASFYHHVDLKITNSQIYNCQSNFYISEDNSLNDFYAPSTVTFENTIVQGTNTLMYSVNAQLNMINCRFSNFNSTMFPSSSGRDVIFKGCEFKNISSQILTNDNTSVTIDNCTFENLNNGPIFYSSNTNIFNISNTTFKNSTCSQIFILKTLSLDNVTFSNINFNYQGIMANGPLKIKNSTMENVHTLNYYFMDAYSDVELDNVTIQNCVGPLLMENKDTSDVLIKNVIFQNNSQDFNEQKGMFFNLAGNVVIDQSQFLNNEIRRSNLGYSMGLFTVSTSLEVTNSTFKDNVSNNVAGVFYSSANNLQIDNCVFENNVSEYQFGYSTVGTGVLYSTGYNNEDAKISNTKFINNSAYNFGVINWVGRDLIIENCIFQKNKSIATARGYMGGGFNSGVIGTFGIAYPYVGSITTIKKCSFSENESIFDAPVIYASNMSALYVDQSSFNNNKCRDGSGAITTVNVVFKVSNSLFENNQTQNATFGVINNSANNTQYGPYPAEIYNSTFVKNTTTGGPGVLSVSVPTTIANSIFWGNGTNAPIIAGSVTPVISNTSVQGGFSDGTKIYDANPKFIDFIGGNYRLSCQSPLINKGNNALGVSLFDLDGTARIFADTIDLGAYETHIDPALANVIPAPTFIVPSTVCKDEVINLVNTTANLSNYTYQWTYGNDQKSTLINPSYAYAQAGTYTITLTASNFCGQSNSLSKQIIVKTVNTPIIETVSVVCPGTEQTYTTNATCQNILWTVAGGTIQSGQGTTSVRILWGDGTTGNGKITLLATGCGTGACEIPVSVEVPIVPANFTLTGPDKVCQGGFSHYETVVKDKSPASLYTWSVKGGSISSAINKGYNLTDIDITWSTSLTEGTVYLTTYNELLKCGKTDSFKVALRPTFKISGATEVCTNASTVYQTVPSIGTVRWQVAGAGNTINSTTGTATWGNADGVYKLTAGPADPTTACNAQDTFVVHVNAKPVVTAIAGETELAVNSIDVYTGLVNTDINNVDFYWSSPGGTIASAYLNTVTIQRNSFSPDYIALSVATKKGACTSAELQIHVKKLFDYTITGPDTVCITTSATYTANVNPGQTSDYSWILNQQGTPVNGITFNPLFNYTGYQQIELKVHSNGKEFIVRKNVYVKSSPSSITVEGPVVIDPAGLQTAVYTVKNFANSNYIVTVTGGVLQSNISNQLTVKWGGTEPFSIQVQDKFASPACNGVPMTLQVKKAADIGKNIIASAPACLNARVDYSFQPDDLTKNLSWSIDGGGSITSSAQNSVTIEWNQTGTHTLTLTYDRFGTQTIQVPIVVNVLPSPVINPGTICGSNSLNISTTQAYNAYEWYLNDAKTAFSALPTPAVNTEGLYTVKVTDNNGCINSSTRYIKQLPLPKASIFTLDEVVVCTQATAALTNIKLSTFEGQDYVYQWYENNVPVSAPLATPFSLPVQKPLNQEAIYAYKVKVSLESCVQYADVKNVIVKSCAGGGGGIGGGCSDPGVSFTVDQNSLCQPFKFNADPSIAGLSGLGWDFGDGSTATGPAPTYKYQDAGIYNVQLTRGCRYDRQPVKVLARAIFKLDQPGCVGDTLVFNDLSVNIPSNKIISWKWNFGDGSPEETYSGSGDRNGKHKYTTANSYTVTLTVYSQSDNAALPVCAFTTQNTYVITPPPTADYIITAPACVGNTYKFVEKGAYGKYGKAPVKWTFSNGQTSVRDTTLQQFNPGNQNVLLKVTDGLGCSSTKSSTITVTAPAVLGKITVTSKDTLLCNGRKVSLSSPVTAKLAYQWYKDGAAIASATNQTYDVSTPGNYSVAYWVTATCNATTAAVKVNSYTVPNLISGNKLNCSGGTLMLSSNLSPSEYSFIWKQNGTKLNNNGSDLVLNNITTAAGGNYQLTVTQNTTGCFATLPDYTVSVSNPPAKPVVNAAAVNICYNTAAVLNTPVVKSGKTFTWYENGSKLAFADTVITTALLKNDASYSVTVKETATGCSTPSDNIAIKVAPAISVVISGDTSLCEQVSSELKSNLDTKDFTFKWYKNNQPYGGDVAKLTFSNIAKADSGQYQLQVISKGTTNLTGCTAVSNIKTIKVKPTAATPVITGVSEFCSGNSIVLSTNLTSDFVWNTGAVTPVITVTSGGTYSVTSTNVASKCIVTATKTVTQNPVPDLSFVPTGDYSRCGTNKIAFDGLNNYPLQSWYVNGVFFSDKKEIYPTKSGKYTLKVTTNKGCISISDTMNIESLECPCYVTNVNDSGDGSLREAINCSNNKPGKDVIKFSIVGTGPFTIKPITQLPTLTDSVVIDGFTQSGVNVFDVIIDGTNISTLNGLVVGSDLANVKISGLKFSNFTKAIVLSTNTQNILVERSQFTNNSNTAVELNYGSTKNIVRNNFIDKGAAGIHFVTGSKYNIIQQNTITNAKNGIALDGASYNKLQSNLIFTSSGDGILINSQSTFNSIVANTVGSSNNNGILIAQNCNSNSLDSNYIGINVSGNVVSNLESGIYISPNTRYTSITANTIGANTLHGIFVEGKNNLIRNNYIGTNVAGNAKPNGVHGIYSTADSLKITGNTIKANSQYGVYIKASSATILANTVTNNISGGIYIDGSKDRISKNIITNTNATVKAINLHLTASAGNAGKLPAVFNNYRRAKSGGIVLSGTTAAGDTVEIFANNNIAQQALLFAGATTADATGYWEIEIPQGAAFDPNQKNFYVNTASTGANNTSELSVPFLTGCFNCVCYVKNTNDSGIESLRATIDESNLGNCLTIKFSMTSPDTIKLLSAVSPLQVPVSIVGPVSAGPDPMIFVKGTGTFNGLVASKDGVSISDLGFTNFKQAIALNSNSNAITDVTVINSTRPITITGNNSTVVSSAINTTWGTSVSTFKADTLVYITGKGNQVGGTDTGNKITNGNIAGVLVNTGAANSILNNQITNSTLAIKLTNNGNTNYSKPANLIGAINGTVATVQGTASPGAKIQLFSSTYVAEQAVDFVIEVVADASGNWTAVIPSAKIDITKNNYFVATATSPTGSTSQLSQVVRVGNFVQVCYVTNTNNAGDGSLREAVNCANQAGIGSNGVAARIEFLLPQTNNEISLLSGLVVTNNFGVEVNARTIPVTVKTANTALNCFNWATNNFKVKNLSFENFANALYCTGTNAVIDSNSFVNNKNAIYVNAADTIIQQTISNNYFTGGTSGITSVKGSLVVAKNAFGISKAGVAGQISGFGVAANHAHSIQLTDNTFANITNSPSATNPATANGYVVSLENASSVVSANIITGTPLTNLPAVRLFANSKSTVTLNKITSAAEGILFDHCSEVNVYQNQLAAVTNRGLNLFRSQGIKISQNTITGLLATKKPIELNLSTANVSNFSKQTPVILTSTYHDGKLFLIGAAEKFDEVEVFYSNSNQLDLVKYIQKSTADSVGNWIISFPIPAAGSDTLFFRAVSAKDAIQSSEASAAFTPKLKICLVTVATDAGTGSLREAIDKANLNQCNLIQFAIPASGVAEIRTSSQLPDITTQQLIIDGTSQSGYVTGSPMVAVINNAAYGFNGQNGNQLDIYGMKMANFNTAINILNSKIVDLNDNVIENFANTAIQVKTSAFTYGTVNNNTIRSQASSNTGISLDGTGGITIDKNRIKGFTKFGITTANANNQKITNNMVFSADTVTSVGISVNTSSGCFIQADTVRKAAIGIQVNGGNGNKILSNMAAVADSISKADKLIVNKCGISVVSSNNCTITSNTLNVFEKAISVSNSKAALINSNTTNKSNTGIYLSSASNGRVANNTIDSTAVGLKFDASHGVQVFNNLITRSLQYGVLLNTGSDTCKFNANLIGARYFGDTSYAAGAGMMIKSSNNYIGNNPIGGFENHIKQNKKGGIIVDGGKKNIITYNFFYNNDISKGRPTAYAINLINTGNNMKQKPAITSHKWIGGKLHVYGTNNNTVSDTIHLYLGTGGYEEVSKFLGDTLSKAGGNWEIIVDPKISSKIASKTTWYVVATATDINRNTSSLSDMYILGDCYITSLKDTTDNVYPLPNTLRMAMKCANGQANPVGVYFNVTDGGAKEVKLQMKLLTLDNKYGVNFDGKNIPDGVIAGMNAQKLTSAAWTIAPTNAASAIKQFEITNSKDGLEILSDSILVQKLRFDKITGNGLLVSNKRNVVDSCVFDSVAVGIVPSSAAVKTSITRSIFNQTVTGVKAVSTDSLMVGTSIFNTGVKTGVDISGSTHAAINDNTFNGNTAAAKFITWDNTKGVISGNTVNAHFVQNPLSISNSTGFTVTGNTFKDSADVYLLISGSSKANVVSNIFERANQNSIKTTNVQHSTVMYNHVLQARNDAFNLESSSTVFISKNTVNNVRYTSKTDSALCINIHKGEGALQSNIGKPEPKNLSYEVKAGSDRRIGIFVKGYAQPGDSIELFFSDTISASMNQYVVTTFTKPDGTWDVKIPREYYYKDTVTWYHVIAVAMDADSNTSKTSSVIDIPPSTTKIYVLNEYNAGPNSLRQALLDVNYSDLYSTVIFSINLPEVKAGPYNIKIDSLFDPIYSYRGFKMDGNTQKEYVGMGPDQRILVNGANISRDFGLDITDSSDVCTLKNMWLTNTRNGLRLSNDKNEIEKFNFINTDSSGIARLDTAVVIHSKENKLKNIFVSDYTLGVLMENKVGKNEFTESVLDSVSMGIVLRDSTYNSLIAKNTLTNTAVFALKIDSAAGDNKIDHNIFGKENNHVKGDVIVIHESNNQTVVYNRISYFEKNDTLTTDSTAISIQGKSSGNYIYANRIGLDSLGKGVNRADVRGVVIKATTSGVPSSNSIIGNEINGANAGAIYVYKSSQDLISENIIGGDSAKFVYGIDSTGIVIA